MAQRIWCMKCGHECTVAYLPPTANDTTTDRTLVSACCWATVRVEGA